MSDPLPSRNQPRGLISNAGWNAFANLFGIAISFLLAPLLIRQLGVDGYGLLLMVWSVTGVLSIANFGVGEATLRFIARYHADSDLIGVNRVLRATLTFYVSICGLVSGVLLVAAPLFAQWIKAPAAGGESVAWLLRLTALLFTFSMITNAYRSIPMAMHRYDIVSRIGMGQNIVRSAGLIALALAGMGIMQLVVWEVFLAGGILIYYVVVARRLVPGLHCLPGMSFAGIREILGYSLFSFLTTIFLTAYREGGKLILGNQTGTASVAYLGTPDNITHRLHVVVVSAIETLLPRFSGGLSVERSRTLLVMATWGAVTCGVVLYLPLAVLMPDFLRLWINPEFARESAGVGRLLAISLVSATAFAPIATLFRGIGRPGFVTLIMALAGTIVFVTSLALVPSRGAMGVGYGYLLSSVAWMSGLFGGWVYLYRRNSVKQLLRIVGLPISLGASLAIAQNALREWWGPLNWLELFVAGGAFCRDQRFGCLLHGSFHRR